MTFSMDPWVKPQDLAKTCANSLRYVVCPAAAAAILLYVVVNNIDSLYSYIQRRLLDELDQTNEHTPHKPLLPFDSSDFWGTIAVTLGLLIAASGGIGGGGILVPLYILIFDFRAKYAVALSNFTIVGSSITNIVLNLPKRHPSADRPLVDWDLILVMEPLTMAGAVKSLQTLIGSVSLTLSCF